eukprot:TRINITY_DN14477_c0_g1_i1.p1 TRINITY_DN14477_c0_g1~~TRINITY_DN14477_c0_g1_i1.p1  ORF type:complete len:223 (-),score=52.27 TRINITY_DN14477_c0_g1_i1:49-717(-)
MSVTGSGNLPYNAQEYMLAKWINTVRENPSSFAEILEQERKPYFQKGNKYKNLLKLPGTKVSLETYEGVAAVDEAINFLRSAKPVDPVTLSRPCSLACKKTTNTIGRSGQKGADAQSLLNGTTGALAPYTIATEMTWYGEGDIKEAIMYFLVGDGDKDRTERKELLDPKWKVMGVAVGAHTGRDYKKMASILFAQDVTEAKQNVGQSADAFKHLWDENEPRV